MSEKREALQFESLTGRFRILLAPEALDTLLSECARAGQKETGGILVGCLDKAGHIAHINEATSKPSDSGFGWSWFRRGTRGLRKFLLQRWSQGQHYLGEWHFHPSSSPSPSVSDLKSMASIAGDESYQCREPILIIVGGKPPRHWDISVTITPVKEEAIKLLRI